MELKTAASAVLLGGKEGGISCFCMDLETAMRSTIYIHKKPQSCFNFSRPSTGWTLLGWDIVAEKLKQDCKSCLQKDQQEKPASSGELFSLWFQFWCIVVIEATVTTNVTQCFSVTPEQDKPEHLKNISVKYSDQFVTKSRANSDREKGYFH